MFVGFAGLLVTGTTVGIVLAFHRGWPAAGPAFGLAAFGLFGVSGGLLSTLSGYREYRGQTANLRSWITGTMSTPWRPDPQGSDHWPPRFRGFG